MKSIQMALLVLLLLGVLCQTGQALPVLQQLLKTLLGTGESDGHRVGGAAAGEGQLYGRKCRGHVVKPTAYRTRVDNECAAKFPSKTRCARICRLEKLKVIMKGRVNSKSWRSYLEYSYPTSLVPDLLPKMRACGDQYVASTSLDCAENEAFLNCLRKATDEVCKEDKVIALEED